MLSTTRDYGHRLKMRSLETTLWITVMDLGALSLWKLVSCLTLFDVLNIHCAERSLRNYITVVGLGITTTEFLLSVLEIWITLFQKMILLNNWHFCRLSYCTGLKRNGKSCRLRWINYLRPGLKRGTFTIQEEDTILTLHGMLGNK